MLNHWTALTLFLRQAGAPLDNNICERALKMAILHRKNSLGYKTQNGARLGDLFMSLIHTCRLCAGNPLDYLNALVAPRQGGAGASDPVVPLELQAGPPGCRNRLNQTEWTGLATRRPAANTALARQADFWGRRTLAEATRSFVRMACLTVYG